MLRLKSFFFFFVPSVHSAKAYCMFLSIWLETDVSNLFSFSLFFLWACCVRLQLMACFLFLNGCSISQKSFQLSWEKSILQLLNWCSYCTVAVMTAKEVTLSREDFYTKPPDFLWLVYISEYTYLVNCPLPCMLKKKRKCVVAGKLQ